MAGASVERRQPAGKIIVFAIRRPAHSGALSHSGTTFGAQALSLSPAEKPFSPSDPSRRLLALSTADPTAGVQANPSRIRSWKTQFCDFGDAFETKRAPPRRQLLFPAGREGDHRRKFRRSPA